ncbi:MAG: ABC transporter ATP-binding protein [Ignavibacteria bacterium]|nr:ABC transporter ATP-binding protein [Ignavibacteria bacterium]
MTSFSLTGVRKSYNGRTVLRDIAVSGTSGDVVGILGANGSGKSTLMRIIAGVLRADAGDISLTVNGTVIESEQRPFSCGYVAPYFQIYDEFTPRELLHVHAELHGKRSSEEHIDAVLRRVGLDRYTNEIVRTFSSGMRQRVSIALAVSLIPPVLMLDEPSTTLDTNGRAILIQEIVAHQQRGGIVFLATNDERERELCTHSITVSPSVLQQSA